MLPFLIFLIAVALLGMGVLALMRFSDQTRLDPVVHDPINTIPQKLSQEKLTEQKNSHGAVTFGTCTQTKQKVWQTLRVRQMNTLFDGPNGVGKTSHILSTALKQDIEWGDNAIVWFEGKSDKRLIGLIKKLCEDANRELVIYPYDKGYNPLNIGNSPKARASMFSYMVRLAREGVSKDAEYFTGEMVKYIDLIVPVFEYVHKRPMIPEELKVLCNSKVRRNELLEKAKGSREYKNYKNTYGDSEDKEFNTVLRSIATIINNLYAETEEEERYNLYNSRYATGISEAIDRKAVVVIAEGGNIGSAEHDRGMIYLAELFSYARSRVTSHEVCLYMDELHYYLTPSFTQFQATSRGAGFIQLLGFQTFAMLEALSPEAARSIKTNCRTWILHNDLDYEDALIVSQKVGERPHISYSESKDLNAMDEKGTQGRHLEDKFLIPPYKVQNIDPKQVLYISVDEDRGKAPARYLIKPPILNDSDCWYTPKISTEEPVTVWEEEESKLIGAAKNQALPTPQTVSNNPAVNNGSGNNKGNQNQRPGKNHRSQNKTQQSQGNSNLPNIGTI